MVSEERGPGAGGGREGEVSHGWIGLCSDEGRYATIDGYDAPRKKKRRKTKRRANRIYNAPQLTRLCVTANHLRHWPSNWQATRAW